MPVCKIPASTDYIHICKLLDCEMVLDDVFCTTKIKPTAFLRIGVGINIIWNKKVNTFM